MNTRDLAGVQVGSEIVVGDHDAPTPHQTDDLGNTARRDAVVVPIGKRLRRNADFFGERRLTPEFLVAQRKSGVSHNAPVLHLRFTSVNRQLIGDRPRLRYHKEMVYKPTTFPAVPDPGDYKEFKDWVRALTESVYGGQKLLAKAAGRQPQAVTGWLQGSVPSEDTLKKMADNLPCNHPALVLLASGVNSSTSNADSNVIRTAELLRHWKNLDDDMQQSIVDHIKSLATMATKRGQQTGAAFQRSIPHKKRRGS